MIKKEITFKRRNVILMVLSTAILTGLSIKLYEDNRNEIYFNNEMERVIGYEFRLDFMKNAHKLKYGLNGESYKVDTMNAIELKVFIDSIGSEDRIYKVDKRICKFMEENNLTKMIQDGYRSTYKGEGKKNLLEEGFYKGIKRANKICSSLADDIKTSL